MCPIQTIGEPDLEAVFDVIKDLDEGGHCPPHSADEDPCTLREGDVFPRLINSM